MPTLSVYIDDDTLARLRSFAEFSGRAVRDLAEGAIAEAALQAAPSVTATPGCGHCMGTGCADYASLAMERCAPCDGTGRAPAEPPKSATL